MGKAKTLFSTDTCPLSQLQSYKEMEARSPPQNNGTQSLEQLVDFERKRFKQALADERLRFAEALEREQVHHRKALKEQRAESHSKLTRALADSGRLAEREGLRSELESVRSELLEEKASAANAIAVSTCQN